MGNVPSVPEFKSREYMALASLCRPLSRLIPSPCLAPAFPNPALRKVREGRGTRCVVMPARSEAWATRQPRHPGRGPQTRRLSAGRRQKRPGLPSARAVGSANTKSCLTRKNFELSGDPPAVPRHLGDWAEEFLLPMLLTVCIEAGRSTLTHTSWTGPAPGSRKWMSGQAAALAARNDRWPFANLTAASPLREPSLPSARRPPSPLDFYLSWMSPVCFAKMISRTRLSLRVPRLRRGTKRCSLLGCISPSNPAPISK
jgi:hypothetical protein